MVGFTVVYQISNSNPVLPNPHLHFLFFLSSMSVFLPSNSPAPGPEPGLAGAHLVFVEWMSESPGYGYISPVGVGGNSETGRRQDPPCWYGERGSLCLSAHPAPRNPSPPFVASPAQMEEELSGRGWWKVWQRSLGNWKKAWFYWQGVPTASQSLIAKWQAALTDNTGSHAPNRYRMGLAMPYGFTCAIFNPCSHCYISTTITPFDICGTQCTGRLTFSSTQKTAEWDPNSGN